MSISASPVKAHMKPVPNQVKARQAYERYKAKTNGDV